MTGISGLESAHTWISIPFCFLYVTAISGNSMILLVIVTRQSLHEPMHCFLSMLSAAHLGLTVSTMSATLGVFWFQAHEISLDACIIQMYTMILTNSRIIQMDLLVMVCPMVLIVPLLLLYKTLSCEMNTLSHSYCYHQDVINICGLIDLIFITGLIHHAFSTCMSHIGTPVVAIFYIPMTSLSLVHHCGGQGPEVVHSMMANVYLLLSPVTNPIIYSIKNKQIHKAIVDLFAEK
uniref:G-protein coupled receptors family 1 profile domain-containing protein n=1 Tax=Jaculus jaculus TaxID=51337 RepID=A0A8C5L8K4_JACJA